MTYVPASMPQPSLAEAAGFAADVGFGSIVVCRDGEYYVSHVPIYVDVESGRTPRALRFHIAARNEMIEALGRGTPALVIVRGPDGYISPAWYDHENVPTWDYAVVQFTGDVSPIDEQALKSHVKELLAKNDPGLDVREEYIDQYLSWIRGFEIPSPQTEPVFKLSQDKNVASIHGVLGGLGSRGQVLDQLLAHEIRAAYPSMAE